jgi:Protein of unknown function (DUF2934)
MTDVFIGTPGSVQRDIPPCENDRQLTCNPLPAAQLNDCAARAEIAEIAYELWRNRACCSNSADADWLEAEKIVRRRVNLG